MRAGQRVQTLEQFLAQVVGLLGFETITGHHRRAAGAPGQSVVVAAAGRAASENISYRFLYVLEKRWIAVHRERFFVPQVTVQPQRV